MKQLKRLCLGSLWLALAPLVSADNDPQLLIAADPTTGHSFGFNVGVSGDVIVVGAAGDDDLGTDAGAVYVFERQAGIWVQALKLTAPDGAAGHNFGSDVALDGGLLAVAASGRIAGTARGGVYVYSRVGSSWVYDTVIVSPTPTFYPQEAFAEDVEVGNGKVAVRGSYWDEYGYLYGRFHVYSNQGAWGTEFVSDHYATLKMGFDGDTLVAGNTNSHGPIIERGFVRVYDYDEASGHWSFAGIFHGDAEPGMRDRFGSYIAVDDDAMRFAVSASYDNAGYLFQRNAGQWEREARVEPLGGGGMGVLALSGEWMLTRWGGGVLALRNDGTEWAEDHLLPRPPEADLYGVAIRVDGATAVVGAPGYDGVAENIGAVFVYELDELVGRYCPSNVNSTGQAARIDIHGTMRTTSNDTALMVRDFPVGAFGMFFYGSQPANLPLGDGRLCVSPFAPGLNRLLPIVQGNQDGRATLALDFPTLPAAGQIQGGDTWNFQFWFRDAVPGGAGSNLSDAVQVTFYP